MKFFYKPAYYYILVDLSILFLSFYIVLAWLPLTTSTPFQKYSDVSFVYFIVWFFNSYILKRYRPLHKQKYWISIVRLFYTVILNFIVFWFLLHNFFKPYSGYVLLSFSLGVFIINYISLSIYYAYRLAIDYNEIYFEPSEREDAALISLPKVDKESYQKICEIINNHSGTRVLSYLKNQVDLYSGNTFLYINNSSANLQLIPKYRFQTIVQLEPLNNTLNINENLFVINEKLPDKGILICCYESKSTRKARILKKYPILINYLIYLIDFIVKRMLPKIFLTSHLYNLIRNGKNQILSKAEVLGRLYCSGFELVNEKKIGNLNFVIVQRVHPPQKEQVRVYGPLIRLHRIGKNGKLIQIYKFRTMHPYSEYLQSYIFERNNLKQGGKIKRDIRITSWGYFLRKYWLDELPMFFNWFKGETKLVGVRPLTPHYYSLYTSELQNKRIQHKPGLLPPFYVDMPETIDEIQASEMKYLIDCETYGTFKTDVKYFFRIIYNIIVKKARSS